MLLSFQSLLGMEEKNKFNTSELDLQLPQVSLSAPDLLQTPQNDILIRTNPKINYKRNYDINDDSANFINTGHSVPNLNTMQLEPIKTSFTTTVDSIVAKLENDRSALKNRKNIANGPLSLALVSKSPAGVFK